MNRSTEVALHHLGNLRAKLRERYAYHMDLSKPGSGWRNGVVEALQDAIRDVDAEITVAVVDDAKRTRNAHRQEILDAIRGDTPDIRDDEEEPPFTVNDIRMDTPDMFGASIPSAQRHA